MKNGENIVTITSRIVKTRLPYNITHTKKSKKMLFIVILKKVLITYLFNDESIELVDITPVFSEGMEIDFDD